MIETYVDTTGEILQLRVTIDGNVLEGSGVALNSGQTGMAIWESGGSAFTLTATAYYLYFGGFLIEGQSVKVEVRKTTASGTGTLNGRVHYATLIAT